MSFLGLGLSQLQAQVVHQPVFAQSARAGLNAMYDMKFAMADNTFRQLQKQYPNEPAPHFLFALNQWWEITANTQDKSRDSVLHTALTKAIDKADAILDKKPNEPEAIFVKQASMGYLARLHALRGEFSGAAKYAIKSLPDQDMDTKYPPFKYEFMFTEGLYNYYAEWYPEQKPMVKPLMLFFPKGDKQKGLAQLNQVVAHDSYSQVEAAIFLRDVYVGGEHQPQAGLAPIARIAQRYPHNSIFAQRLAETELLVGRNQEAVNTLLPLIRQYETLLVKHPAPITLATSVLTTQTMEGIYLITGVALYRLQPKSQAGFTYLLKADKCCVQNGEKDAEMRAAVLLALGKYYDVTGKRDKATEQYTQVVSLNSNTSATEEANRLLKEPATKL